MNKTILSKNKYVIGIDFFVAKINDHKAISITKTKSFSLKEKSKNGREKTDINSSNATKKEYTLGCVDLFLMLIKIAYMRNNTLGFDTKDSTAKYLGKHNSRFV